MSKSRRPEPLILGGRKVEPGDRIDGFIFERELGSGGMARVLLARGPDGKLTALKVLRRNRFETGLPRFQREYRALSRINHPNVVRVHALGDIHGHPYIAMEYVDGPDLHSAIRSMRRWERTRRWKRVEEILVDLCRALAAIHRRGLVHRDLKPSNVLLTPDGVCKLTDFGIVKDLDPEHSASMSTTLVGTWAYTSPEHISGKPVDHRADLYSLGVILFTILTGKRPFVAKDMAGYLRLHRGRRAPAPREYAPDIPEHLDEICRRLLEKNPRDRFQSATEILYRLEVDVPDPSLVQDAWTPTLVGREEQTQAFDDVLGDLVRGDGAVVAVVGEDGAGKTRLVKDFRRRAEMLGTTTFSYRFRDQDAVFSTALQFARDLSTELGKEAPGDLMAIVQAHLDGGSQLLGDARYSLYDEVKHALMMVCKNGPVVLFLDDLHLAAVAEWELISFLVRAVAATQPLLVVATVRTIEPAYQRDLGVPTHLMHLNALGIDALTKMIEPVAGSLRDARLLAERLQQETEGNAFFATEFLRTIMAHRVLPGDAPRLPGIAEDLSKGHLEIPPSIRAVLRQRVADLTTPLRRALDVLAVSGSDLDLDVLLEILDADEEHLERDLDLLARKGLVSILRRDGEAHFATKHSKLAEVLNHDLQAHDRARLHRSIAEALRVVHPQEPDYFERIGHHYRCAGDAGRAYRFLVKAANQLLDRSLNHEAWSLSQRADIVEQAARDALDTTKWEDIRRRHLRIRGECLYFQGRWADAEKAWSELLDMEVRRGELEAACDVGLRLAGALNYQGRVSRSYQVTREALQRARKKHYRRGVASGLRTLAGLAWNGSNIDECERFANEGLVVARGKPLALERAHLLMVLTAAETARGHVSGAIRGMEEASALFEELAMLPPRAVALANLSEMLLWTGRPVQALERSQEAHQLASDLDYQMGGVATLRTTGMAFAAMGSFHRAHDYLHRALRNAVRIQLPNEVLAARVELAKVANEVGDRLGARQHAAHALNIASRRDPEAYLPLAQAVIAHAVAASDPEDAVRLLAWVEEHLPENHVPRRAQVMMACTYAHHAIRDHHGAKAYAERVVELAGERGLGLLAAEARAWLARNTHDASRSLHENVARQLVRQTMADMDEQQRATFRQRRWIRELLGPVLTRAPNSMQATT